MGERNMSLVYSSNIDSISEQNASFDKGVLRVCYTGKNRNGSFISKETFDRCMPSIYNCPIVCRYDRETDSIGAHDMELVADADGGLHIVNVTQPVGVIPESSRIWYEEIEDESGVHEYLCADALLWKRQEAYRKIKEDGITEESMEISVQEGEMVDGVYIINRFEFTAFCLLGSAEPCYESASLEMFSRSDFQEQLAEMMKDFKESFSMVQPSADPEVVIQTKNYTEGGDEALEQKNALMAEFGLTADMLDFDMADFTVDELREKFEAIRSERFALEQGFRSELWVALETEQVETKWGTDTHYWFWDYDKDVSEVYATDVTDWNLYGFSYSMNGDHVVIDFASKKRMKLSLEPFNEGDQPAPMTTMFAKLVEKYTANDEQWAEKYQSATDTVASMEGELDTLRQFKSSAEEAAARVERDGIFSQFEDLVGVEAYETLREHCTEYSVEDLEEKCYAIRGRNGTVAKFSHEPKAPKLPIEKKGDISKEPYNGAFVEFGIVSK